MAGFFKRRISEAFDQESKSSFLPQAMYRDTPNEPNMENKSDWSIPYAEDKNTVVRPSVKVNFLGTEPKHRKNSIIEKSLKLWHERQDRLQGQHNSNMFDKALFILSQSSTGRDLLERMTKAGYEIVFDEERTKPIGAGGLCDPTNKLIVLGVTNDPEYLALVIGHEAVHALQYTTNNIFPNSVHTPQTAIQLSFAIEADAYAQQTQIALELAHGDPAGPKNQIIMKGPLHQMRKRMQNIVDAAEQTLTKKENLSNGAAVAAAFEGFFDNIVLRSFYEDAHINWANSIAPELKKQSNRLDSNFINGFNAKDIPLRLKHKGVPYLKQHAPNIDFDSARHSGLTKETQDRILDFYKTFKPKSNLPELKTYGTHINNAEALIFGRDASTNLIVMKNQKENKPPNPKRGL